jgi:hypothetical protein
LKIKIGAGTSLPSVVARKCCNLNRVIITDNLKSNQKLKPLILKTLELNNIKVCDENDDAKNSISIWDLNWNDLNPSVIQDLPKIDYLLGSDVFFDSKCKKI